MSDWWKRDDMCPGCGERIGDCRSTHRECYRGPAHEHDNAYRELETLRKFDALGVRLQRAVQDAQDSGYRYPADNDEPGFWVPDDEWLEVMAALKAIYDTAHDLAFPKPQPQSSQPLPAECSICRRRHGKEIQHACE